MLSSCTLEKWASEKKKEGKRSPRRKKKSRVESLTFVLRRRKGDANSWAREQKRSFLSIKKDLRKREGKNS